MQNRNSSLDLLRGVSMFMVLTVHFLGWGGAVNALSLKDMNYFAVMPIYFISQIGNTLFFLLTGYFANGTIRPRKLVFLQKKTSFYVFLISLAVLLFGLNPEITPKYVVKSLFPIVFNRYWFISVYFMLYLIGAPLYKGLKQCSSKVVLVLIGALLIHNTFLLPANMTLLQGVLAFIVGHYLREYKPFVKWNKWQVALAFAVFLGAYTVERIGVRIIGMEHTKLDEGLRYALLLATAVMFFAFFEKLDCKAKWPSKISGYVLSVYLISACPPIVDLLYSRLIPIDEVARELWFVPYYSIVNVLIFATCVLVDVAVTKFNNLQTDFWIGLWRKFKPAK